jgi:hypothetical protein
MGASMNASTEWPDGRIVEDAINWEQLRYAAKLGPGPGVQDCENAPNGNPGDRMLKYLIR